MFTNSEKNEVINMMKDLKLNQTANPTAQALASQLDSAQSAFYNSIVDPAVQNLIQANQTCNPNVFCDPNVTDKNNASFCKFKIKDYCKWTKTGGIQSDCKLPCFPNDNNYIKNLVVTESILFNRDNETYPDMDLKHTAINNLTFLWGTQQPISPIHVQQMDKRYNTIPNKRFN